MKERSERTKLACGVDSYN